MGSPAGFLLVLPGGPHSDGHLSEQRHDKQSICALNVAVTGTNSPCRKRHVSQADPGRPDGQLRLKRRRAERDAVDLTFDPIGQSVGSWNVVVIGPTGQTGTLANGFTVQIGNQLVWSGSAGDGLWNTAANWTPAQVPASTNVVTIDANATVTASGAAVSFLSLTLGRLPCLVLADFDPLHDDPLGGRRNDQYKCDVVPERVRSLSP